VPAEAWWDEKDREWVLGARDAQGRLQGVVRYWRPDGTLCCTCEHVDDKPHGQSLRYHESGELSQRGTYVEGHLHGTSTWFATDTPTTEKMHVQGMSPRVRRSEYDFEHGALVAMRYFDGEGRPVSTDGKPLPPRPETVDARATYQDGYWVSGRWTETGLRNGLLRYHSREGVLIEETEWRNNVGEGIHRAYDATGELREEVTYRGGLRDGLARAWRINGTLAREATLSQGEYHGFLRDYDATGTKVVREVRFIHGVRQNPAKTRPPRPEPAPAQRPTQRKPPPGEDAERLDLSHSGLEQVPYEVREYQQLAWLRLAYNPLRSLPAWLVELKSLQALTLEGNPLPLPRLGREVVAWMKRSRALPIAERRVRFCLFMGDLEQAQTVGDVPALARALDDPDPAVRAYAALALKDARPSPLSQGRRVYLAGVPRQRSRAALRQELQAGGLKVVEDPAEADVLLVLDRPGRLASDERPIAVEAELPVPPFDAQALARLYATAETHPSPAERLRARRQLRREAPPPLWAFLQGYRPPLEGRDERKLAHRIRTLGRSGFLDPQVLAETVFQHTRRGVPLLIESGGPRVRSLLASLVEKRTLNLELKGLRYLPPEIGDLPDLGILKLGYNKLTRLPDEIGDLFSLVELDLFLNPLQGLPRGIGRLAQLRKLRLSGSFPAFPEELTALTRLTHLNLGSCKLREVPEAICRLMWLQELYLDRNQLTTLPPSFAELQRLTFLHMTGNAFATVPPPVFELRGLKTLWLESCNLRSLPADIARLTELEMLCIWYNPLESLPIEALASLPRLRELRIRENRLSEKQEAALRAALPRCTIY
jgi:Leucine-rich repeat (LRR) protein/antitoxin component YwqK of YwqJK toxin-antitoxin module